MIGGLLFPNTLVGKYTWHLSNSEWSLWLIPRIRAPDWGSSRRPWRARHASLPGQQTRRLQRPSYLNPVSFRSSASRREAETSRRAFTWLSHRCLMEKQTTIKALMIAQSYLCRRYSCGRISTGCTQGLPVKTTATGVTSPWRQAAVTCLTLAVMLCLAVTDDRTTASLSRCATCSSTIEKSNQADP